MSVEILQRSIDRESSSTSAANQLFDALRPVYEIGENGDAEYAAQVMLFDAMYRKIGYAYAQVQARYDQGYVQDGALEQLTAVYAHKISLYVPEQIKANIDPDIYTDILEEYGALSTDAALMDVMLAPPIDLITVESLNPTEADLKARQVKGLEDALTERDAELAEARAKIASLETRVASLQEALDEQQSLSSQLIDDVDEDAVAPEHHEQPAGPAEEDEDLDVYERQSAERLPSNVRLYARVRRLVGALATGVASTEVKK